MSDKIRLAAVLAFLIIPSFTGAKTVYVRNQDDFDGLSRQLRSEILTCTSSKLKIVLDPGTYIASDLQFYLADIKRPDLSVIIKGRSAVVIPCGVEYKDGDLYEGCFNPHSSWMSGSRDLSVWSEIQYADGTVEILDEGGKQCRLRVSGDVPDLSEMNDSYILIPHWFRSSVYKIDKVESQYLYFTASDLSRSYNGGFNVNDDYNYGKKRIRFKLCNAGGVQYQGILVKDGRINLPAGIKSVREGRACRFLEIRSCEFKSLEVKGLSFNGNGFDSPVAAIKIIGTGFRTAKISKCVFSGFKSKVIVLSEVSNLTVDKCCFSDCYLDGIVAENGCANIVVKRNVFQNMGLQMMNSFCIISRGEKFRISGNRLSDYGYGGIGVGVWYKSKKVKPCSGFVENNTLLFSPGYIGSIDNYGIMDGGAIYVWTQNDDVVIRNNSIDGYTGIKDNRGVFCDDGAYNVSIYDNTITGVVNSYSIDSRRVERVETEPGSMVEKANVNNRVYRNTVDSPIRFEPREGDDNGCYFGENTVKQL